MRRTSGIGLQSRRRTTAVGLGALSLVVMVAAPLGGRFADDPPPVPLDPVPSTSPVNDVECPPPRLPGTPVPPVGGNSPTLPGDPVAVRMCDAGGLLGRAPLDALAAGAPEVASAVNALHVGEECRVRPADIGPTWDLVFRYADGSRRTVRGSAHGCGGVEVGPVTRGDRSSAKRPLRVFQRLLWRQRASAPGPSLEVTQPRCPDPAGNDPGPTMMPLRQPLTARMATLCWTFDTQAERQPQSAGIAPAHLKILLADLNTHASTGAGASDEECRNPAQARWRIQVVNTWGDHFELDGWCGVFEVSTGGASTHWRPSPESRRILDGLAAAHPMTIEAPDASTHPSRIVELWADLHNAGRPKRAAALWRIAPPAPEGRVEVRVEDVERVTTPSRIGTPTVIRAVTALYWVVATDGTWDEVYEVEFAVTRLHRRQRWRITSMTDLGVVHVGR